MPARPTGPCDDWLDPEDLFDCGACSSIPAEDRDAELAARMVTVASEILYMASGRQYPGLCEFSVRPCLTGSCWGPRGGSFGSCSCGASGWDSCGCGGLSEVLLPGPVVSITSVTVDGVVLDAADYRVDGWRRLVRLGDESWPGCQDLDAPTTEDNTWVVVGVRGTAPPESGVLAATDLACELYRGCSGGECKLPKKVTNVVRQGTSLTFERPAELGLLADGRWRFGIASVDMFLSAYGRPPGRRRGGSIASVHVGSGVRRGS